MGAKFKITPSCKEHFENKDAQILVVKCINEMKSSLIDCIIIRIEVHILSLHWMKKNISYLNVCEAQISFLIFTFYIINLYIVIFHRTP